VIFYDKLGTPRAFGAETDDNDVCDQAANEEWTKAAGRVRIVTVGGDVLN
jgi:hypothetical protein